MTTYNTGNPLGSTDPRDLFDNAENLDGAVNSTTSNTWVDRLGVTRKTFNGMEQDFQQFLLSSGYDDLGAYQAGIQVTARNQIILSAGEYWRVAASTSLPYTTTGAGMPEGGAFVSVGDAVLRQELSDPSEGAGLIAYDGTTVGSALGELEQFNADLANPDKGAAMVARGVVAVDSIADLLALPEEQRKEGLRYLVKGYHAGSDVGGGEFYFDASRAGTNDGGLVLDGFIRRLEDAIYVEFFGATPESADNTSAYDALVSAVPAHSEVQWTSPGQVYRGHFNSPTKALRLDVNKAILSDALPTMPVVSFGNHAVNEYAVEEVEVRHKWTQFTVVGAEGLFSPGDIGYLWDQAVRPAGGSVNFEVIKIKSVAGDTVRVEGFIASYKGVGAVKFYHSPFQMKGVTIKNAVLDITDLHNNNGIIVSNSEHVDVCDIEVSNFTAAAVTIRYSYDINARRIHPNYPKYITSGRGYGFQLFAASRFSVQDIHGIGCRHVYDQDSAYFGTVSRISDPDDQSSPVVGAHNGFAGYVQINDVEVSSDGDAVSFGSQGYDGFDGNTNPLSPKRRNHPYRSVHVRDVVLTVKAMTANDNVFGVYFQNSVTDCSAKNIKLDFINSSAPVSPVSAVLRIHGVVTSGTFIARGLSCNVAGSILKILGDYKEDTPFSNYASLKLYAVSAGTLHTPVYSKGPLNIYIEGVSISSITGPALVNALVDSDGAAPRRVDIGQSIQIGGASVPLLMADTSVQGVLSPQASGVTGTYPVADGGAIDLAALHNRCALLRLNPGAGPGTVTLGATPIAKTAFAYQECYVAIPAGNKSVHFPRAEGNYEFTLQPGVMYRLFSINGVWSTAEAEYTAL